jgi:hypothetical protein
MHDWLHCSLDESISSIGMRREHSPRYAIPLTFASSLRNSSATDSGAGEKDRMLWITLVASILELGM